MGKQAPPVFLLTTGRFCLALKLKMGRIRPENPEALPASTCECRRGTFPPLCVDEACTFHCSGSGRVPKRQNSGADPSQHSQAIQAGTILKQHE